MANTNWKRNGAYLDTNDLELRAGTAARTGSMYLQDAGGNLNNTFMDIDHSTCGGATQTLGIKSQGVDIGTLFCKKGNILTGYSATISNVNISGLNGSGGSCSAGYELKGIGDIWTHRSNFSTTPSIHNDIGDWLSNKTGLPNSLWQYNITADNGMGYTSPSGTAVHTGTDDWSYLNADKEWHNEQTGVGTTEALLYLKIREASNTSMEWTATITIKSSVTNF